MPISSYWDLLPEGGVCKSFQTSSFMCDSCENVSMNVHGAINGVLPVYLCWQSEVPWHHWSGPIWLFHRKCNFLSSPLGCCLGSHPQVHQRGSTAQRWWDHTSAAVPEENRKGWMSASSVILNCNCSFRYSKGLLEIMQLIWHPTVRDLGVSICVCV